MDPIEAINLSAQRSYQGRGNPPSTHPKSSIANCFPGLEFDFRAIWKHVFTGFELHEANNVVLAVAAGGDAAVQGVAEGMSLISVGGRDIEVTATGPRQPQGPSTDLALTNLEWTNALAAALTAAFAAGGPTPKVACVFRDDNGATLGPIDLEVRRLIEDNVLVEEVGEPGSLTQGLCSPWQNDYRECGCYYWAASRPDFVLVDTTQNPATGRNWMDKTRTRREYRADNPNDPLLVTYDELFQSWEKLLPFEVGIDEEQ